MTGQAFNPQTEQQNTGELNKPKDAIHQQVAAARVASDFLTEYKSNPTQASADWQGVKGAITNPDARNLPGLHLVDNLANGAAIDPLIANNGSLFQKLDTYNHPGSNPDGNISQEDMKAYLNDKNNDQNSEEYKFVQRLSNGQVLDSNGHSVLNGNNEGIDSDQIGRLTGVDISKQDLKPNEMAKKIHSNLDADTGYLNQYFSGVSAAGFPVGQEALGQAAETAAGKGSVAQAGDGYLKIAQRLLGKDNSDDPDVIKAAKELQTLNPGQRGDGMVNLNEQILTPQVIAAARNEPDKYPEITQILTNLQQQSASPPPP